MVFDHMIASGLVGAAIAGLQYGMPKYWFVGAFAGSMIFAPMSWWVLKTGRLNALGRPSNIFYENGVSAEEIERIRHIDMLESLSH